MQGTKGRPLGPPFLLRGWLRTRLCDSYRVEKEGVRTMPDGTRILTTHAGSLPRPPELTRLFASRSRGKTVDEEALAAAGREAVSWVVAKQRQVGIDVISNGEQQRESFVLYLRRRLSGIGGKGDRAPKAGGARVSARRGETGGAGHEELPGECGRGRRS